MTKPRIIITTDVEVDDMNSLIHLCLYLNDIDLLAIVYSSSQYHFLGDGIHTLGEITPNYRTSGPAGLVRPRVVQGPDPGAKDCYNFRPFEKGWIEKLIDNQYRSVYGNLIKHDPAYPDPDHLLSITKYGNIEFEGDVRFDTEGSDCIKQYILDDFTQPLYLLSWGGVNTIVRSLLSIYETYRDTEQWNDIYRKIVNKVRLLGVINYVGQDNSYLQNRINELYPDLVILRSEHHFGGYQYSKQAQSDIKELLTGDWMYNNIATGNGVLMEQYHLMGDGKYVEGEPDIYQFGINAMIDFGKPGVEPSYFGKYEFLGEGDSNTYIPLLSFGLRGLENYDYGTVLGRLNVISGTLPDKPVRNTERTNSTYNPFIKAYQLDWAARAKWCVTEFDQANHPVEIKLEEKDICAKAGESVKVNYTVTSKDTYPLNCSWDYYHDLSDTSCENVEINHYEDHIIVKVPKEAKPNDYLNLILTVRDESEHPITTYGQLIIHIKD